MPEQESTSYTQKQGSINQNQGNLVEPNEYPVYTRKSIGYADGYSQYNQRTGGHKPDGTELIEKIIKDNPLENFKSLSPELLLDGQSDKFRRSEFINGYGGSPKTTDAYEDPTYLIFDLNIMKDESPLFRQIGGAQSFIDEYSDVVPELDERYNYLREFNDRLFKIFPSDNSNDGSGIKKHYIESIGGLDVLLEPIVNYPEAVITFQITEDVAMSMQYLAELYNNLIYSYDSHRYLIPDNLLRFNMRITVRDMRNMKVPSTNNVISDVVNENISKFIYVLHDCQFNFMKTKNFGAEIRRGGFAAASASISAGGTIEMNFKSYSKIMAPLLIDNSKIVDFRERETQSLSKTMKNKIYQVGSDSDYKSQDEVLAIEKNNEQIKNVTYRSAADIITSSNQDKRPGAFQFPEINTSWRGFKNLINKEIIEVRNVIIKQIYSEVNQLITAGERLIGNKLGFTLGKTNVYYMSLEEKAITRFAFMFQDLLNAESHVAHGVVKDLGKVWTNKDLSNEQKKDMQSAILNQTKQEMGDTATDRLSAYYNPNYTFVKPLNSTNVYPDTQTNQIFPNGEVELSGNYNQKYPKGDLAPDGKYNQKYPKDTVEPEGTYNQKYPKGDLYPDGKYNQKYPSGEVEPKGKYNMKYPEGDLAPDGKYNEKYPIGDLLPDGKYNEKYPEGIVEPKGIYNEKYPSGDLTPDGKYNEKYPIGDLLPDGKYNMKYPEGDLAPNGKYNMKYPEGVVEAEGTYNMKYPEGIIEGKGKYNEKYPKGIVEAKGKYNEKYPEGSVESEGQYNQKYPKGSIESEGQYNEKYPSGDLIPEGRYNQKYPKGSVEAEGTYNQKFPEGDSLSEGKYNEKYPEGDLHPDGTPHNKQPKGSVEEKGKYNEKPPTGNIYGKNKPLPPAKLKLGNVNKNKRQ